MNDPHRPIPVLTGDTGFAFIDPATGHHRHVEPQIETEVPAGVVVALLESKRVRLINARDWPDPKQPYCASFTATAAHRADAKIAREARERHRAAAAA